MKHQKIMAVDYGHGELALTSAWNEDHLDLYSFDSTAINMSRENSEDYEFNPHLVEVDLNGDEYEVGHYVHKMRKRLRGPLNDKLVKNDVFKAISRAALKDMKVESVDILVVGLPEIWMGDSFYVKHYLTGTHHFKNAPSVTINEVDVVPQVRGVMYPYTGEKKNMDDIDDNRYLVVSLGYNSFDWMVFDGCQPIPGGHGGLGTGLYDYLNLMADEIGKKFGQPVDDFNLFESSLLHGIYRSSDLSINVENISDVVDAILNNLITTMLNRLGQEFDFHEIILTGGGASLLRNKIKEYFPRKPFFMFDRSNYDHLDGLLDYGYEKYLKQA